MNLFLTTKIGEMKTCLRAVAALSDQTIAAPTIDQHEQSVPITSHHQPLGTTIDHQG